MAFRFLEDIAVADIAFEVEAKDLAELFSSAAEAMLAAQVNNPEAVEEIEFTRFNMVHKDVDILLYQFLQELVYLKDVKGWLLRVREIKVEDGPKGFALLTEMGGEELDPKRHEQRADIKAVTFHGLEVKKTAHGYKATVIIDV